MQPPATPTATAVIKRGNNMQWADSSALSAQRSDHVNCAIVHVGYQGRSVRGHKVNMARIGHRVLLGEGMAGSPGALDTVCKGGQIRGLMRY
jgi:azurin